MIERKFITEKVRDWRIKKYLSESLNKSAFSHANIQKTPLGVKIIIHTSKPGLVVGSGGQNIRTLSETLQKKFKLDNPQIEVSEVKTPELDAQIMSERIAFQLERWGVQRFKKIGYSSVESVMKAGAQGVEIKLAGKVPGARATRWRFTEGYLPRAGPVAKTGVSFGASRLQTKPGITGIKVRIMLPETRMPDEIIIKEDVNESQKS